MNIRRVKYINKIGFRNDLILAITKKRSKDIVCKQPDDGAEIIIPRGSVKSIEEPQIEKEK